MDTDLKMNKRAGRRIGFGLTSAGFVFLFLPDLMLIDILPDAIGYALIAIGLSSVAFLDDSVATARKLFLRLTVVAAIKPVALFAVFSVSESERMTFLLLAVAVLSLFECIWLIPAYSYLAEGLLYLGTRLDSSAVFGDGSKRYKGSYTDSVFRFSKVFAVVKAVCVVCPELLSLIVDDSMQSYNYSYGFATWLLRILGIFVSLIFGIIWLVKIEKYFRRIKADGVFIDGLTERYRKEIVPNDALFIRRRAKFVFVLLAVAAVFSLDIYIGGNDGFSILPDVLCAAGLVAAAFLMKKFAGRLFAPSVAVSTAYGIVTAINWKLNYDFVQKYGSFAARVDETANRIWKGLVAASVVEALLFAASVWLICLILCRVVKVCTGYTPHYAQGYSSERVDETHRQLSKRLYISAAFGTLSSVFIPVRVALFCPGRLELDLSGLASSTNKFLSSIAGVYNIFSLFQDISWIVEFVFAALFVIVFAVTLYKINEETEEKYMLS